MNALRKDLRAGTADAAASNLMVGIGETYLPAFVLALSADQLACGLVATVPMIVGAAAQLVSPYAVRRLGSHRRWVVWCALVQAAAFVPLMAAALVGAISLVAVFALASLYWASGLASTSAWNVWVETLIPKRVRTRYLARRSRMSQFGLVTGIVCGGLTLQAGARSATPLAAFAVLFSVAAGSRLVSAYFLGGQREPVPPAADAWPPLARPLRQSLAGRTAKTLWYLLAVQAVVQISGPYFTPYMLGQLKLSYASYVALIGTAYVAKMFSLPAAGWAAHRWGTDRLLWIGGLAIVPVSGLWCLSNSFAYLCGIQVLSGVAWGAYELAMLLVFFETIPISRRLGVLTLFNFANALAMVLGSIIGGALLAWLGPYPQAYLTLFAVSSVGRAAALLLVTRLPQWAPPVHRLRRAWAAVGS